MTFSELIPVLHELPRADKFRALQFLSADLAQEDLGVLTEGGHYPVWSPLGADDAAAVLTQFLKQQSGGQ